MISKKKVLHIATVDTSLRYLLLNQLKSIENAGYEIATASTQGNDVRAIEAAGIRHIAVPIARSISPISDLKSFWQLYSLLRSEHFDIVHTHNPKPGLLGQLAARLAGVPVVVNTLHGFYFHEQMHPLAQRFYIMLERVAALCSDVILSQNHEDMQTAIEQGICPPEKIKYLGNGIDLTRFDVNCLTKGEIYKKHQELGLPEDALIVGYVGRLAARRKGFRDFLEAGKALIARDPRIRLLIIGEADLGKSDAVTPEVAAEYGIANRCLFLGHLPNEQLPIMYTLMNVLVLPSLFEGFPRVVMEASAMGVPCVVTDVKGNREAVEDGRNGILVPHGNVEALADAIYAVLMDEELARQMGTEGEQLAASRFDESVVFETVLAEYARLLLEKGIVHRAQLAVHRVRPSSQKTTS